MVIYEPKGRALEYSPLALNLYTGCVHHCNYCFSPGIMRKKWNSFFNKVEPKKDILERLEKDCKKMEGDTRDILLCFMCDPYQPIEIEKGLTREALLILERYNMRVQVLTKGGERAERDFDILKRNGWKFGSTITHYHKQQNGLLEQNAPNIESRIHAIKKARSMGIYTWVSIEPVMDPAEAILVVKHLQGVVNFWKIGKINYHKYIEEKVDWGKFLVDIEEVLEGEKYYIKKDLEKYRNIL